MNSSTWQNPGPLGLFKNFLLLRYLKSLFYNNVAELRMSLNKRRLEVVDFLRGFSIFTIVLMHLVQSYPLPGFLMKASSLGGAGVHVFLLCSGFGLYLSSLYKPLDYRQFLKRRFSKVYVPYLIVVLISALYFGLICNQDVLMQLLGSVFLFKMFVPSLECAFGGQMWFVSTIIQFYLFWPFIVKLFKINRGRPSENLIREANN